MIWTERVHGRDNGVPTFLFCLDASVVAPAIVAVVTDRMFFWDFTPRPRYNFQCGRNGNKKSLPKEALIHGSAVKIQRLFLRRAREATPAMASRAATMDVGQHGGTGLSGIAGVGASGGGDGIGVAVHRAGCREVHGLEANGNGVGTISGLGGLHGDLGVLAVEGW